MFSKICIKRPVTTIMVLLIVLMTGIVSVFSLKLDLMPNIDLPVAIVSTTYVGAGPDEIEKLVTKPLEDALGTVSSVDKITSVSSDNSSMVIVQFVDGTDIDMAAIDMREKVDLVKSSLPDDADDPMVLKLDVTAMSSIVVGLESDSMDLKTLNSLVEDSISDSYEKIDGVASVTSIGGIEEEVQIVVDPEKLEGYGLTESSISQVLAAENLNMPGGSLKQGTLDLTVRTEGEFKSVEEIGELPLTTNLGAVVHLRDVAKVELVDKDMESYALIDGKPSMLLLVQKQSDANTVDVSKKISKQLAKTESDFPQIHATLITDTADYITSSVSNMVSTAFQAALLAVIVIFLFLRSGKMSFIIGVSIPTSIIATFALMWSQGMTMNLISMGGLTIGIGMLVDNSIVVLEIIYQKIKAGMNPDEAAAEGANEVASAVAASTLTTLGVFVPLMFVTGVMGDIFKELSLTVCFALIASLIVSLTFVPMACAKLLDPKKLMAENGEESEREGRKLGILIRILNRWGKWLKKLDSGYRKVLHFCLLNKKKVFIFVVIAFILSMFTLPVVGVNLMPDMDEGSVTVTVKLPDGTVLDETEKMIDTVTDRLKDMPEIDTYYAMVGNSGYSMSGGGTNSATLGLTLVDAKERNVTSKEFAMNLEESLKDIPGCEITASADSSSMGSMGSSKDVTLRLKGDDTDTLRSVAYDVEDLVKSVDGTRNVENSSGDSVPEATIKIDRTRASNYGITAGQVASAVSTAINGTVATQYKTGDGDTEIDVRIKQSKDKVEYMQDLSSINITSPVTGGAVPLSEVADIVNSESSVSVSREDHHKYIDIEADVDGRDLQSVQKDIDAKLQQYNFPDGYEYEYSGTLDTMTETFTNLIIVLVVAISLVYMIMAAQFESYIYPFIIMFSIPLAITGGVLGLFVTGNPITSTAFLGFIMLAGMVVNNAIVLVDAANQNVKYKNMDAYEAIETAGPNRLRPILMTTLTTVIGMIPMWLSTAEGTEMNRGMAVVIIFGLSISTLITLIFIPVLYVLVEKLRFKSFAKRHREKKERKYKGTKE